jgi:hypothetical protein
MTRDGRLASLASAGGLAVASSLGLFAAYGISGDWNLFAVGEPLFLIGVLCFVAFFKVAEPRVTSDLIVVMKKYILFGQDEDRKKLEEAALTAEYFSHQTKDVVKGISVLAPVTVLYCLLMHEFSALLVWVGYCAISVTSLALTHYRVKHGFFGSTAAEAAELIEFVTTQMSDGTPPKSRKVSIPLLDRVASRVRELEGKAVPEKA